MPPIVSYIDMDKTKEVWFEAKEILERFALKQYRNELIGSLDDLDFINEKLNAVERLVETKINNRR